MHNLSLCFLLIMILTGINARSCPEEYRELRRRDDEMNLKYDDEYDDVNDYESRESLCEQAMDLVVQHRNFAKLNPSVLLTYCPHYDERLALAKENNNTLCENKKQELHMKRKRQELSNNEDEMFSDDDDDKRRRTLRRQELKKRFALRFIRKRMSKI